MIRTKRVEELHYRGSRSRHEVKSKHSHKAALPFRGKGSKTERRSAKSRKRRKMS